MSSEETKKIKEDKSHINLDSTNSKKDKTQKDPENLPEKKTDMQYPSSTLASINNTTTNNNEPNNKFNFFQSTKVDSDNKANDINLNDKICCYCTKTRCIKKYCECYSNNRYCKNCHCVNCLNKFIHKGIEPPKESVESNEVFCTCSKSNCNKKYCECFKSSQKCTFKCRCINCKNCNKQTTFNFNVTNINNINNNSNINSNVNNSIANLCENKSEIIDLEEKEENEGNNSIKSNSRKSSLDSNDSLQIQRVSVYINKYQTVIDVEKFTKEMMMFNSKKRKKV